ncbi:helix-turn-helix domain-containing protein [Streptomyces aidingensis]|uniref:Helix-turn-helix domain-containing protein n=1 Tax=Streptomyces aidingensis TaxID=910347 RepID=A0A1I1DZ63_9ACTN|nr:helix-turn-helix transcriptional regulator [Streptomyces aidingensis]SFB80087.1 Helix-turn-helix domain-containing protein [Streptomyces aidingensis]
MGLRTRISQRQRRVGQELQRLREVAGLSGAEAGAHIGLGRPHMSHVEAGRTHISEANLRTLCQVYGCTDSDLVDVLVAMSQSDGKGWWTRHRWARGTRAWDLAELESLATHFRIFEWLYVPGLLQTSDYMRSLFTLGNQGLPKDRIDEYTEFRLRRQQVLTDEPLRRFHAIIHESAFHMEFADPQVMRRQLEHLVEASQLPNVVIQVLPFSASRTSLTPGAPFNVYDLCTPSLRTVYVEHPTSAVFLADHSHLDQFAREFDRLSSVALAPLKATDHLGEGSLGFVQHKRYLLKGDNSA